MSNLELRIEWDTEIDNLLIAEMTGAPTWDEYHTIHDTIMQTVKNSDKPVVHLAAIAKFKTPKSSPFSHYQRSARRWEAASNTGFYIIVLPNHAGSTLIKTMVNVLKRLADGGSNYPMVNSLSEARDIIRNHTHQPQNQKDQE